MLGQTQCRDCGVLITEANAKYRPWQNGKYYLQSICRPCVGRREYRRLRAKTPPVPKNVLGETKCSNCGDLLTDTNAKYDKRRGTQKLYLKGMCKRCLWKIEGWRIRTKKHGIDATDYTRMHIEQGGVCAICRQADSRDLSVDHDHTTHAVRGLLCRKCNLAISLFDDDENLFWNALEYLKTRSWNRVA